MNQPINNYKSNAIRWHLGWGEWGEWGAGSPPGKTVYRGLGRLWGGSGRALGWVFGALGVLPAGGMAGMVYIHKVAPASDGKQQNVVVALGVAGSVTRSPHPPTPLTNITRTLQAKACLRNKYDGLLREFHIEEFRRTTSAQPPNTRGQQERYVGGASANQKNDVDGEAMGAKMNK